MSSDEENYAENVEEIVEDDESIDEEPGENSEDISIDLSLASNVNLEINRDTLDDDSDENGSLKSSSEGKIGPEELPHSGNTLDFKTKFETTAEEEEYRTERRLERRRQRRLTEEDDGPSEGTTLTTRTKFEKGEVFDDVTHITRTEVVSDEAPSSGKVLLTTEKFITGDVHPVSSDENGADDNQPKEADEVVIETGTAASRRKELEEKAEESKKGVAGMHKMSDEVEAVLNAGLMAKTRAKLEKIASQDAGAHVDRHVDEVNAPKRGTASERRAKFEEKARQSSDEGSKLVPQRRRATKWPEPNTNYRQRTPEPRVNTPSLTDEHAGKNGHDHDVDTPDGINVRSDTPEGELASGRSSAEGDTAESETSGRSSVEGYTAGDESTTRERSSGDNRRKFGKTSSQDRDDDTTPTTTHEFDRVRPPSGMARNLRAKFETGEAFQPAHVETASGSTTKPAAGYASRVKERFESGDVMRSRNSSSATDESDPNDPDVNERKRRTSSGRSIESETAAVMRRSAKELRNRFENPNQATTQAPKRNFVVRTKPGAAHISSKFTNAAPSPLSQGTSKCTKCSKTVYITEMITADNKPYHKVCFKCAECKCTLRLGNYAALEGQIYCKPHLKQLFKAKGNYDEGFGREQRKKDWVVKRKTTTNEQNGEYNNEVDSDGIDRSTPDSDEHAQSNGYAAENGDTNGHVTLDHDEHLYDEVEA